MGAWRLLLEVGEIRTTHLRGQEGMTQHAKAPSMFVVKRGGRFV